MLIVQFSKLSHVCRSFAHPLSKPTYKFHIYAMPHFYPVEEHVLTVKKFPRVKICKNRSLKETVLAIFLSLLADSEVLSQHILKLRNQLPTKFEIEKPTALKDHLSW